MGSHARTRIARVVKTTAGGLVLLLALGSVALASSAHRHGHRGTHAAQRHGRSADAYPTATPIKHIVVVFQENRSFDRYFGTYPHALTGMFDFQSRRPVAPRLFLDPNTGEPVGAHIR